MITFKIDEVSETPQERATRVEEEARATDESKDLGISIAWALGKLQETAWNKIQVKQRLLEEGKLVLEVSGVRCH